MISDIGFAVACCMRQKISPLAQKEDEHQRRIVELTFPSSLGALAMLKLLDSNGAALIKLTMTCCPAFQVWLHLMLTRRALSASGSIEARGI